MKNLRFLIVTLFVLVFVFAGNGNSFTPMNAQSEKVKVYYFHTTRRCPTCLAIEKETQKVLKEKPFSDAIENGDLEFNTYNAEETANEKLVKELGITGSALIVVKGKEKIDLTSKGFLYGLKQPEKLRQALRETLND